MNFRETSLYIQDNVCIDRENGCHLFRYIFSGWSKAMDLEHHVRSLLSVICMTNNKYFAFCLLLIYYVTPRWEVIQRIGEVDIERNVRVKLALQMLIQLLGGINLGTDNNMSTWFIHAFMNEVIKTSIVIIKLKLFTTINVISTKHSQPCD